MDGAQGPRRWARRDAPEERLPLAPLAVLALLTAGSLGLLMAQTCRPRQPRLDEARLACATVRRAAELHQALGAHPGVCPTLDDLVRERRIDAHKIDDPWGTPLRIECAGEEIQVISAGADRRMGTADDVHDR